MIEAAIVTHLLASPAVTALVGDRIRPMVPDQGSAYPHLVYVLVSDADLAPSNLGRSALRRAQLQFDCWGRTAIEARRLADDLAKSLDPHREPGDTWVPIITTPAVTVRVGRETQRLVLPELDAPVPNQPSARPVRVVVGFAFDYHLYS